MARTKRITDDESIEMKMVSAEFPVIDVPLIDKAAARVDRSRASFIRCTIMAEVRRILNEMPELQSQIETAKTNVVSITSRLDNMEPKEKDDHETYGPPTSCPCCGATVNELGDPEMSIVRSASNWGAWGCYKCNSNGRWYDDRSAEILLNTCTEDSFPVSASTSE